MKKTARLLVFITFTAIILYAMAACKGPVNGGDDDLAGNITITPSGTVTAGTALTAVYSGNETVDYQWNKDGVAISGATNATFTPTEAGQYTVTVSVAGYNSKTSAAITVVLSDFTGTITITPNTGIYIGMTLVAEYSGAETVGYQWNRNGTSINGAIVISYIPTEAGQYTVTVSAEGYNSKTSAPVTVTSGLNLAGTVSINPSGPVITGTTLTGIYSGAETVNITCRWNRDGIPISGATNAAYTPTTVGDYTITVGAAGYNSKTSAAVTAVFPILAGTITIIPNGQAAPGITLTAVYGGTENVSFQWNRNGTVINNATSAEYTPVQTGNYTVTVNAEYYTSKTSTSVSVLYYLSGNVAINPNNNVFVGTALTAYYSGYESVSYQWYRNGTAISGATTATHTPVQAGSYTVTVSAVNYHSKTSAQVAVDSGTINVSFTGPSQKVISINRNVTNNLSKNAGGAITLSINESFDRYEWFVGTTNVASGNSVTLYANNPAFITGQNWITVVVYTGTGTNAIPWSGEFFVYISE